MVYIITWNIKPINIKTDLHIMYGSAMELACHHTRTERKLHS